MDNSLNDILERICIIIPAYNNAVTVSDVIRRAYRQLPRVIVVNDGSNDETASILAALDIPITLVAYDCNRGKGYALIQGVRRAIQMGYDYAITLDADGQHYPEDIPALLKAHIDNPEALIVGSRDLRGKEISKGSVFANKFANFWFTLQTVQPLPDTQTGYRLYPLHHLHWLRLVTSRYEAELELLVYTSWHGVRLLPVPVNVYYPPRQERVSHFRPIADFGRISLLNTVLCLGAVFYGYPRKLLKGLRALVYSLTIVLVCLIGVSIMTAIVIARRMLFLNGRGHRMYFHRMLCASTRAVITHIPGVHMSINNLHGETFEQPAVIISNHQSHLDLLCAMALTPKMIIITKDWVWNNPLYGIIIRYAEYFPITFGYEKIVEHCSELVKQGYSILVYPEGTRSADCRIQRFHRGAFYLAEQLKLDIIPIIEHGPGKVLPKKGVPYLRTGTIQIDIKERISSTDTAFGTTIKERTRNIERYIRNEYIHMAHGR